jgi:glycosyltransferase involved in cell wall biosynthesis
MPCVSVVIPVYNRRALVSRATRSVLAQTYSDYEILVVDDGSQDGSAAGVRSAFGDSVRLLQSKTNRGVSAARNLAIGQAAGQWLAFLDSDDEWLPDKLERQMAALEEADMLVCHTEEIWVRNGVRVNAHKHHKKYGGEIFLQALPLCVMSPSSIVIHRDVFNAIGLFDEALPACEDYDLFLRLTCRYPVIFLDQPLIVKYGGHADQLSQTHFAMDRFRVYALDKILQQGNEALDEAKRQAAVTVLLKKAGIVYKGACKHGNDELVQDMERYLARWQQVG